MLTKLLSWIRGTRHRNRKELFTGVIDPLFTEVQPVLDDYLALFRTIRGMLASEDEHTADEIVATLVEKRMGMSMARIRAWGIAAALRSSARSPQITKFGEKIERLFLIPGEDGSQNQMRCHVLLRQLENGISTAEARQERTQMVEATLQELEGLWVSIAQDYGSLKLRFLAPMQGRVRQKAGPEQEDMTVPV